MLKTHSGKSMFEKMATRNDQKTGVIHNRGALYSGYFYLGKQIQIRLRI